MLINLTSIASLKGSGSVNGVEFDGHCDVSQLLGEHDVVGKFTMHNHTVESAIHLSYALYQKVEELEQKNKELEIALHAFDNIILGGLI